MEIVCTFDCTDAAQLSSSTFGDDSKELHWY